MTAAAAVRWRPPTEWMDRVYLESYGGLDGWAAAELAAVLNALGRLRLQPPVQWMAAAAAAVGRQGGTLGHQVGVVCLIGCGGEERGLLLALPRGVLTASPTQITPTPITPTPMQELNNCMWALRVLRYRPADPVLAPLAQRAAELASEGQLDVRERGNLMATFELLQYALAE